MRASLLRSLATVSGLTLLSRVLGFGRQVLIAGVIGASGNPVADAFWAAFRLPNMFRRLFAEGAFQAAFIPLFQGKLSGEEKDAAKQFAEEVAAFLLLALSGLTAVVMVAAPIFVYVVASGFEQGTDKFSLTTLYLRIMFPYLACMSMVGLLSGVLNAHGRFAAYAAAPLLLNICQIAAIYSFADSPVEHAGLALAVATMVSGVAQFLLLFWGAQRQGYRLRLRPPKLTPDVKRLLALGAPGFLSAAAVQVNIVVGTNIASRQPGAVSWLMNADQLYQLPLSLIGIALGSVLLPHLSRKVKEGDDAGADDALNRALELSALLCLPAAAALMVMAEPLCDTLFRGIATDALQFMGGRESAFTPLDVAMTGAALSLFGAGVPAFVWQKVFLPAYFAREDTKTPMNFALAAIALNTVLALILFPFFGFLGVAAATSIAAWLQAGLLARGLLARDQFHPDARLRKRLVVFLLAGGGMAAFIIWATPFAPTLAPIFLDRSWIVILLIAGIAAVFYGLIVIGLGGARLSDYKSLATTATKSE
ncbi:MAG: murein biosynthesis integral membrane protein MurJ [Pseudomonadota bacterium]